MNGIEPGVSVVIKAYNEALKIDGAIRSALAARCEVEPWPLEVVVADGLSSDGTAERAMQWALHAPVRVVQLRGSEDRTCGAGTELGFLASRGPLVLFMDGDMQLQPGFLAEAVRFLESNPRCAGVAGVLREGTIRNGTDRIRQRRELNRSTGAQQWLNGGGLYRRQAILEAGGYAGDERLAAFEEADLGLRLARAGWGLHRLAVCQALHEGHEASTWRVLCDRWRAGRHEAAGRLLRIHGAGPGRAPVWRLLAHPLALLLGWVLMALGLGASWGSHQGAWASVVPAAALAAVWMQFRRTPDAQHVLTSWLDWHMLMLGIIMTVVRPWRPRKPQLAWRLLADGAGLAAPGGQAAMDTSKLPRPADPPGPNPIQPAQAPG